VNLQLLFDNFEQLAEAPNGVEKLRELILQLAVQGMLVPQDPNDEPAYVLLKKIRARNRKLFKAAAQKESEPPYQIPHDWNWVYFPEVFDIQGGTQPPKSKFVYIPQDGYTRLLQIRDFGDSPVPTYIPEESQLRRCAPDDVMIARYGASIGKIFMGQQGVYNVALARVIFDKEYIYNRYYIGN
jgi:type I restriction enzyme S subunit